ncbi:MAG: TIGR04454 family lipoprotein [Spirochaetota bacterium]
MRIVYSILLLSFFACSQKPSKDDLKKCAPVVSEMMQRISAKLPEEQRKQFAATSQADIEKRILAKCKSGSFKSVQCLEKANTLNSVLACE